MNTSSRFHPRLILILPLLAHMACDREARTYRPTPPSATLVQWTRLTDLQPGAARAVAPQTTSAPREYEENAYSLSEGKRLFSTFNCTGCHAHGGGDIGPALMDDTWIYGFEPEQIFSTIVEGRPNGMPSFGGRVPEYQIWQLAAYVRSLSGLVPKDAAPARNDDMQTAPAENSIDPAKPVDSGTPPSGEMPQ